ncbi:hypothetical protein Esti_003920 [Eimeria stiedai]
MSARARRAASLEPSLGADENVASSSFGQLKELNKDHEASGTAAAREPHPSRVEHEEGESLVEAASFQRLLIGKMDLHGCPLVPSQENKDPENLSEATRKIIYKTGGRERSALFGLVGEQQRGAESLLPFQPSTSENL